MDIAGIPAPTSGRGTDRAEREAAARVAREFEAQFLLHMLKQMRQSMLDEEDDSEGFGSSTLIDTVDSELARQLAGKPGGLGETLLAAFERRPATGEAMPPAPLPAGPPAVLPNPERPPRIGTLETLEGPVSSNFGWRQDPLAGGQRFHKGIDIRAAYGRPVPAAADGIVIAAGRNGGYGESILVDHGNGLRTRYAHLSSIDVTVGARVTAGTPIGRVGSSGRATGAHLHFEVLEHGRPLDPASAVLKLPREAPITTAG